MGSEMCIRDSPRTLPGLGEPGHLQLAIRLEHGGCIHCARGDDLSHGWQPVTGMQQTQPHRLPHLAHQLRIDGHAARLIDMEVDHTARPFPGWTGRKIVMVMYNTE